VGCRADVAVDASLPMRLSSAKIKSGGLKDFVY